MSSVVHPVASRLGAVLWVLLAALPASSDPFAGPTPPEAATLWGVVAAPDGSRLPGAIVRLTRLEGGKARVAAGALGVYRAAGLAPGTWRVVAESPGFAPARHGPFALAAGESRQEDLVVGMRPVEETVDVVGSAPQDSVEGASLRESGARDVAEALSHVPGIWMLRRGGIASDVVLRGLQSRDISVLVDGDRVYGACPNHMDPPPFHVDFAEVERVEVAKGPFDVSSQGSLGGAVNIVTRDPEPGLHVTPSVSLGSYSYVSPSVTLSRGGEKVSALAGFSWRSARADRDGDGRRFTEYAGYQPATQDGRAFGVGSGWARLGFTPGPETTLTASYTRQEASRLLYPYLLMDAVYDDTDRASVHFEQRRRRRTITGLTAQAFVTRVEHWMTDELRTSGVGAPRGWSMGTMARARTFGGRIGLRVGRTSAGVEVYRRYWDAETQLAGQQYAPQPSIPGVRVDVLGAYVDYSRVIGYSVLVEAGARLDAARSEADPDKARTDLSWAYLGTRETSRRDVLPSGRAKLAWRPGGGLQLSLSVGHAARVPEASERYFSLRRMGTDWVGNPSLAPSRNTGVDLGIAWRRSRFSLRASVFGNRVGDFIVVREVDRQSVVPGVVNARARTWANVDATLAGGELSGSLSLERRVFLSGDFSWVRGRQTPRPEDGIVSGNLAEIPPWSARIGLRIDDGRVFAAVDGVFAGRQDRVDPDLGEEPTPTWGVLNAAVGVRHGRLALTVGAANLLDRTYSEHLSYQRDPFRSGVRVHEPGRNLYVNASARF